MLRATTWLALLAALAPVSLGQGPEELPEPMDFPYRLTGILGGAARFEDATGASAQPIEKRSGESIGGYVIDSIRPGGAILRKGAERFRIDIHRAEAAPPAPEVGAEYPWAVPEWRQEVRGRLTETVFSLDVRDEPLDRILERIQEVAGISIRIDPRVYLDVQAEDLRITLSTGVDTVERILAIVLAGPQLEYELARGGILVAPAGKIRRGEDESELVERGLAAARAKLAAPGAGGGPEGFRTVGERIDQALQTVKVPSAATGRPFVEVADELYRPAGAQVSHTPREVWQELSGVRLPAELAGRPLVEVARFLSEKGFSLARTGTTIAIGKETAGGDQPKPPEDALAAKTWTAPAGETSLRELAARIRKSTSVPVYPEPELWRADPKITLRGGELSLGETLGQLAGEYEIQGVFVDGALFLVHQKKKR